MDAQAPASTAARYDTSWRSPPAGQPPHPQGAWTMLELLPQAVLMVKLDRTVLASNLRAQRLLQDQCLRIADGRLAALGQMNTLQLTQLLHQAEGNGSCDCSIWFEKNLSTGWLRAISTTRGGLAHLQQAPPQALLLVVQIDQPALTQSARIDALARKYLLSPTERHVLMLLADGLTVELCARHLGLQLSTLRTHVRNLLGKTQAPSLMQLLRWTGSAQALPH